MKTAAMTNTKPAEKPAQPPAAPEITAQQQAPQTPPETQQAAPEPPPAPAAAPAPEPGRIDRIQPAPQPAAPPMMHVLDLSATFEPRIHEMAIDGLIKQFKFLPRQPTALPPHIAVKFLKYPESFKLTNEDGDLIPFQNTPKQPHELQAGERFKLDPDATIARFNELHTPALLVRTLQLEGGERFAGSKDRQAMIDFIIAKTEEKRSKNMGREPGLGIEEWTPPPENDSALDTGAWA